MKLTTRLIMVSLIVSNFSCSTDSDELPANQSAITHMPLTPGNWWAYVLTKRNSAKGDVLIMRDTLRVIGQIEQNGQVYAQLSGSTHRLNRNSCF